jgi:hypothetical protein
LIDPRQKKEVRYFETAQHRVGSQAYFEAAFRGHEATPTAPWVDFTPTYLTHRPSIQRIVDHFCDSPELPTFSAILRHPAERAWSSYVGSISKGEVKAGTTLRDASTALKSARKSSLLGAGLYGQGLAALLYGLPLARVNIVAYDDVLADPVQALNLLTNGTLLEVERWVPPSRRINASYQTPRLTWIGRAIPRGNRTWSTVHRLLRGWFGAEPPRLPDSVRDELSGFYSDDVALLSTLTGRDFGRLWGF